MQFTWSISLLLLWIYLYIHFHPPSMTSTNPVKFPWLFLSLKKLHELKIWMELSSKVPVFAIMHFEWWREWKKRHRIQINLWFFPRPEQNPFVSIQFHFFFLFHLGWFSEIHTDHGPRTTAKCSAVKNENIYFYRNQSAYCSIADTSVAIVFNVNFLSFVLAKNGLQKLANFIIHIKRKTKDNVLIIILHHKM